MVVKFTFQSVFGNSRQNPRHFSARGREESLGLYSILWSDWSTSKQRVLRHGNRFPARVRRRYFSEGEKRRPEMRLRFADYALACTSANVSLKAFTSYSALTSNGLFLMFSAFTFFSVSERASTLPRLVRRPVFAYCLVLYLCYPEVEQLVLTTP